MISWGQALLSDPNSVRPAKSGRTSVRPMLRNTFLAVALLLLANANASAQTRILDLVPEDAAGALFIRGVDAIREKGDKLIADSKIANIGRPSDLFNLIIAFLGIQGGVDGQRPIGILAASPTKAGARSATLDELLKLLVVVVPFNDLDKVSAGFGFGPGQLKPGQIASGKGQNFGTQFYVEGKYFFIGTHAPAIEAVVKRASFSKNLDAQQAKLLGESDLLLLLGKPLLQEIWRNAVSEQEILNNAGEDKEVAKELVASLQHLRCLLVSLRIDHGVAGSLIALFEPDRKGVEKLLARLQGGGTTSSLAGLPMGQLLAAQALQGDGAQNSAVAKAILTLIFQNRQLQLFNFTQRPNIIAVFAEGMQHLKGMRFAVYQNPPGGGLGELSAAAVLRAEDAARFLKDVKDLARMADSDKLDFTEKSADVALIRKLVADLGSDLYRVRESATTRLKLIGERAVPFLEAAHKSQDLEIIKRARRIEEQILNTAAARRKELLSDDLYRRIKPSLVFSSTPETWQGHEIYSAYLKLADADKKVEAQLQELLGPDWRRIRFAVHHNDVAVAVGSDPELLQTMLVNLKERRPGLAKNAALAGFERNANQGRNFEMHLAARGIMSLVNPTPFEERQRIRANPAHTSVAMTVGAASVQVDLWLPPAELGLFIQATQ